MRDLGLSKSYYETSLQSYPNLHLLLQMRLTYNMAQSLTLDGLKSLE